MNGYTVRPDVLARARQEIEVLVEQAHAELRTLSVDAAQLRWHGGAGTRFRAGWEQWRHDVVELLAVLHDLAALLGTSGVGYEHTETSVAAAIGSAPR